MFNADGPDTSHYQTITFETLIPEWKLWSHKATEGRSYKDPTLPAFLGTMSRKKVRYRGLYHWLRPDHDLASQFANLKSVVDVLQVMAKPGFMIQVDWERTVGAEAYGDKGCATQAQAQQFWNMCQRQWPGRVIMYSANWVPGFVGWRNSNPTAPVWYANYTSQAVNMANKYDSTVVQWTSTYNASGFTGKIDMNQVLKWDAMDRLCGYTAQSVAPVHPEVVQPQPVAVQSGGPIAPHNDGDEMQVIADSDDGRAALVTFTRTTDNVGTYTMAGVTGEVRAMAVEAGMKTVDWPAGVYDLRAAQASR